MKAKASEGNHKLDGAGTAAAAAPIVNRSRLNADSQSGLNSVNMEWNAERIAAMGYKTHFMGFKTLSSLSTSTLTILTSSTIIGLFSFFYYHGKSTAFPAPQELPPLSIKKPYYLHYLLIPSLSLPVVLLIGAKLPPKLRILFNIVYAALVLSLQWEALKCGTRSSAFGFAFGTAVAYSLLQILDLLFLSNPIEDSARIPVLLSDAKHMETNKKEGKAESEKGHPPKEQPFPHNSLLRTRLAWVLELTNSMRLVGWDMPIPKSPNYHHPSVSSDPNMYISRTRFLMKQLLALIIMAFIGDFLIWNIRFNDTAYYFPNSFRSTLEYNSTGRSGGSMVFSSNYQGISIHPPGIFSKPIYPNGYDPSLTPHPKYIPPLPYPTSLSSPLYQLFYTFTVFTYRFFCQGTSVYISVRGCFTFESIVFVLLGLIFHPQPYTYEELISPSNSSARWFHPLYYPPINGTFLGPYWGTKGIGGYWSRAWHSSFRRVYARPGIVLTENLGIKPTSLLGGWIILVIAYLISGGLHYLGILIETSFHTVPGGEVEPLPINGIQRIKYGGWGVFSFFVAQILGITVERLVLWVWHKSGQAKKKSCPKWIPFLWTWSWFMITGYLFFDDYRWAGLWRTEPTPLSIWGALMGNREGTAGAGGGWWRWGRIVGLKEGETHGWWEWSEKDVFGGWGIVM